MPHNLHITFILKKPKLNIHPYSSIYFSSLSKTSCTHLFLTRPVRKKNYLELPRNLSKNKLPKLLFLSHHLAFFLVEGRGRKKSLKNNRKQQKERRKISVVLSLKMIEGSVCTINKYQELICMFLKARR